MSSKNQNLIEKIRNLKDRVSDIKDYLQSDFCKQCFSLFDEIKILEKELEDLENERH